MIVICLTDCPPKVRGDLSKWLMEINTGVYVGKLSARVRDELWERICKNLKSGRATMVYSAAGEQKMEFRVHNTPWEVVDFEGLHFMRRPLPGQTVTAALSKHFSNAAKQQLSRKAAKSRGSGQDEYCAIDLETTGLSPAKDEILEFGAVYVRNGTITEEFSRLAASETKLTPEVARLTGISEEERAVSGVPQGEALSAFLAFVGTRRLVCHNAPFDSSFLRAACKKYDLPIPKNQYIDTLALSRRRVGKGANYRLRTIAAYFGLDQPQEHRALNDSRLTAQVYEKLKELSHK